MFVAVVFLYVLFQVNCEDVVRYKCGKDGANTSMTFTPSVDGVQGRYTVELCTVKNPNVTLWQLNLWYYNDPARCRSGRKPDGQHSVMKEQLTDPYNCTNVCYSVDFDLIFKACYNVQSALGINNRLLRPRDIYVIVNNNITRDIYENNTPHVSFIPHEKMVTLHWYLGLPVTFYDVTIIPKKNNRTEYEKRIVATEHCAVAASNEVKCRLELGVGCYQASFQHYATWSTAFNEQANVVFPFCVERGAAAVAGGAWRLAWWAGAGAACAAAALAALLARHALRAAPRKARPRPLQRSSDTRAGSAAGVAGRAGAQLVVLLYAREGERAQRAADALKALLQRATGAQVLDLFSPEVLAAAAGAPATWLRAVLQRDTARVVLLQTPALAALYTTHVHQHTLNLSEPLLGRRAMYRCPQFGDQLLLLALRLITESAAAHHDYNKYYLATYGALRTEALAALVPYRRYVLAPALAALLRDLAPPAAPPSPAPLDPLDRPDPLDPLDLDPAALQHYYRAVEEYVTHAQQNPDYLTDELLFM